MILRGCEHCTLVGMTMVNQKKQIFQGMHPHLRDSMCFLDMKEDVGYQEFLAVVYEDEIRGVRR